MSLLTMTPDAVSNALDEMPQSEVRRNSLVIKTLLTHKSPTVRWSAAAALGRAKLGAEELRSRLGTERHELVLVELIEALGALRDVASASRLRKLLRSSQYGLVRSYAGSALSDVLGDASVPDLVKALKHERSRRVIVSLNLSLFWIGVDDGLPVILRGLEFRDYCIRCQIGNTLAKLRPRRHRKVLLAAVEKALAVETTVAARESLGNAAKVLSKPSKARSSPLGAAVGTRRHVP